MQTFISAQEATSLILENTNIKDSFEYIPIENAINRICYQDVLAKRNSPAFDNSSMDGYACKSSDGAKTLKIAGSIFAGDESIYTLKENECYKIMTGALMPQGADAIVPFENAINPSDTEVTMPNPLAKNQNLRTKGEEFQKDKTLLQKGNLLTPQAIALLATQGIMYVCVYTKLKIAIVSSGDEIIEPWNEASEYQIYNSNTMTLKMLLKQYGFDAQYKGVFPDNLNKSIEFIKKLKDYDVIISTGGVSMGEADFVGQAFIENEMNPIFHKINIKPGKPMLYGKIKETSVFALPGNPMSSFMIGLNFVIPSLLKAIGSKDFHFNPTTATTKAPFRLSKNRAELVLGELKGNEFRAIDDNKYNSAMLSPLVKANAIALFDKDKNEVLENESIKVVSLYSSMVDVSFDLVNE